MTKKHANSENAGEHGCRYPAKAASSLGPSRSWANSRGRWPFRRLRYNLVAYNLDRDA